MIRHDVLPYSGPGGFAAAATGVVREAIDGQAVPVVLADPADIEAVRSAVNASVLGFDMSVAGRNPSRLLPAMRHFLDEHPGRELVCVSEPVKVGASGAMVKEMQLHELLLQLPLVADWNCRLTCAYDSEGLAPPLAAMMAELHGASEDPSARVERARAEALPARPPDSSELGVDMTTLHALRGFVRQRAEQAGLDDERVDDLVYAVNETVTNSICHGEGRARVSLWTDREGTVVCEVRDRGHIRDPLAGRVAPHREVQSGRGLWLVNQLCDLVELRSSPTGTTLRLHVRP